MTAESVRTPDSGAWTGGAAAAPAAPNPPGHPAHLAAAPPWHHRGAGGPVRAEPRCYRRVARTRRLVGAESADAAERGLGADCPVTAAAEAQPLRQPQGLHASRPSGPSDPVHLTPS